MTTLLETLLGISPKHSDFTRPDLIQGYTEAEIDEIERCYHLSVQGTLREMFRTMGRCSGGLILGEWMSVFKHYNFENESKKIAYFGAEGQLEAQHYEDWVGFLADRQMSLVAEKYLHLAFENEGILQYFLLTNQNNDVVYEYDSNLAVVQFREWGSLHDWLVINRKASMRCSKRWSMVFQKYPNEFAEQTTGQLL